ncbi:MAG: hypothetical protein WAV98_03655 [Minisyncoccia bacterium]
MIKMVLKTKMSRRFPPNGRTPKEASAVICLIQHCDDFVYGPGIFYPDEEHLCFNECKTLDPRTLWRAMYAVSKASCLSDEVVRIAIAIADKDIPINDPQFDNADLYLKSGYTPAILRLKTFEQDIPPEDIRKIVLEFNRHNVPINNPFKAHEGGNKGWRISPKTSIEIKPLSFVI